MHGSDGSLFPRQVLYSWQVKVLKWGIQEVLSEFLGRKTKALRLAVKRNVIYS